MQSYRNYDYRKVFFRRPIWTELNVLFLNSLLLAIILVIPLTIASVNYYSNYPNDRIRHQVNQNYIVEIVKFYENREPRIPEATTYNASFVGGINLGLPEENVETTIVSTVPDSSIASAPVVEQAATEDPSLTAGLNRPSSTSLSVQNAIGSIDTAVKPAELEDNSPLSEYVDSEKAYDSKVREMNKSGEDIGISGSEFTDFGIVSGFRKQEEAMAIANENKKFVRHCIDKVYRNDPTLRGQMVIKFDVHPEGYTIGESIKVIESDIEDPRIMQCIKRSIRRWRNFPKVAYENGNYSVTQKFVF